MSKLNDYAPRLPARISAHPRRAAICNLYDHAFPRKRSFGLREANPGAFQISRAFDFNIWFQANNFIQFEPYVPGLFIKRIQWKSIDCHPHKRFAEIAIFSGWMRELSQ